MTSMYTTLNPCAFLVCRFIRLFFLILNPKYAGTTMGLTATKMAAPPMASPPRIIPPKILAPVKITSELSV